MPSTKRTKGRNHGNHFDPKHRSISEWHRLMPVCVKWVIGDLNGENHAQGFKLFKCKIWNLINRKKGVSLHFKLIPRKPGGDCLIEFGGSIFSKET